MIGTACYPGALPHPRHSPRQGREPRRQARERTRRPDCLALMTPSGAGTTGGAVPNAATWRVMAAAWRLPAGSWSPAGPMPPPWIGCAAASASNPSRATPTSDQGGTDGRACERLEYPQNKRAGERCGTRWRARFGSPAPVLQRPDNQVSRRVPAVSRRKYAEWKHETPYSQCFTAFVPVVSVVPA